VKHGRYLVANRALRSHLVVQRDKGTVHETVEKADSTVLRCSRNGGATERWLEPPALIFDRAACLLMGIARDPRVDLAALSVLQALIAEAAECSGQILSSK
jgi:hypothetical protein